jgi:membrane protein YdbS with pleckstrin-like domain
MADDEADWSPLTPQEGTTSSPSTDDDSVPEEDSEEYTTDQRTISARIQVLWGLRLVVGLAVLTLIVNAGTAAIGATLDPQLVVGVSGAVTVLGLVWVHLRYRVWRFRVRDDALYLERGVFTHVRTVAPHVRIQHVDTSRSPGERALGLSSLVVYTAGSRGADVSIPGLTPSEADDLQRRLKELAIESEGGDAL